MQKDDWLSKYADKYLGNVQSWPAIMAWNNKAAAAEPDKYDKIDNADLIVVGWSICVPSAEDAEAFLANYDPGKPEMLFAGRRRGPARGRQLVDGRRRGRGPGRHVQDLRGKVPRRRDRERHRGRRRGQQLQGREQDPAHRRRSGRHLPAPRRPGGREATAPSSTWRPSTTSMPPKGWSRPSRQTC